MMQAAGSGRENPTIIGNPKHRLGTGILTVVEGQRKLENLKNEMSEERSKKFTCKTNGTV
jgi:hypothetical protein